jgi:hypothetical protein
MTQWIHSLRIEIYFCFLETSSIDWNNSLCHTITIQSKEGCNDLSTQSKGLWWSLSSQTNNLIVWIERNKNENYCWSCINQSQQDTKYEICYYRNDVIVSTNDHIKGNGKICYSRRKQTNKQTNNFSYWHINHIKTFKLIRSCLVSYQKLTRLLSLLLLPKEQRIKLRSRLEHPTIN